ncbi:MBL fold metallo-hydrolase [Pedobacter sp. MR2016-24]|uniref:MBL fold metallo-hydrolase n=1 Tax=Pedobacter sp. MR2016-24 TaxID=2994466 RepID=UPI00224689A9|nr:MBL fold metallo-hydrolase [Pedobacter sp. MR2016-24]MCX2485698.1 MBL fold metallo-hydrolase [Pedobacter sp. MR2016-24]
MKEDKNQNNKSQLLVLPAFNGDCLIMKTFDRSGNPFIMLIDGGTAATFDARLKREIRQLEHIDVIVLTHIDSDHIGGLIKYIKSSSFDHEKVGQFWFNSKNLHFVEDGGNISYGQAKTLEELLIDNEVPLEKIKTDIYVGSVPVLPDGIEIELLSPTSVILDKLQEKWLGLSDEYEAKLETRQISESKPSQIPRGELLQLANADDTPEKTILADVFNSSSIAFVLRTFDLKILFLGDSHPHQIMLELDKTYSITNKLSVDLVKISHHGSKNNTMNCILDVLDCDRYIISTNGGSSDHTHPDRETIARVVHHPYRVNYGYEKTRKIYLNYPIESIEGRAGIFVEDNDFKTGNWELRDKTNIFQHE